MASASKSPSKDSLAPASANPKAAPSHPKAGWLSSNQKIALIGGLLVLVVVLGFALFSPPGNDATEFTNYLYRNNQSGILMDVRNSPSSNVSQKILQCGVNLIASGFYATTQKDLLVYACDDSGCISSHLSANATALNSTNSSLNTTVPFSDALYAMRERAYFHIRAGAEDRKVFHPTYTEVYVSPSSSATCSINVQ